MSNNLLFHATIKIKGVYEKILFEVICMTRAGKSINVLLVFIILISSMFLLPGTAYSANTSCLTLIETQKGKWAAYGDMILYSGQNTPMLKLSEFCDAMEYDYSSNNSKKQFGVAKNEKVKNIYTIGKKEYVSYSSNGKNTILAAKENASYDKTLKANLCDANTVSSVCYAKVSGTSGTTYGDLEYAKVMCFSKYSAISALPDIKKIAYEDGKPLYDPGPVYKSLDGNWRTKMFYMDGILNGEKKQFYITHRDGGYDANRPAIEFTASTHNEFLGEDAPEIGITIGKSAKQGDVFTREALGYDTIEIKIVIFEGFSGKVWDLAFIKEATVRLDSLDRQEGTITGYVKIIAENDQKKKANLEGYFADNIFTHSKKMDSDQYSKVKQLKTAKDGNPAAVNNPAGSDSPAGSGGSNSNLKLVTIPCTTCGGTGKIICGVCHGVGYKESWGYKYGVYGKIIDPCLSCGGAGARICSACGGAGSITRLSAN